MTIGQREATTVGSVISVNVGMPRDVEWAGRTVRTAIWKEPTDQRVAVEHDNLAGDRQADRGDVGVALLAVGEKVTRPRARATSDAVRCGRQNEERRPRPSRVTSILSR